ncbi:hypothetical protein H3Z85_18005 [Chryseobacterium indologenes]|uniref:DUF6922 domain-containing protein n=1 Tax=Chryseobacterium indologenes TaxID=253 RepID=UPI0003E08131|nr:hypothetical protein [Chryseobacterium indologenes]QPQ51204.1 hypothetical protein H3Z85_18005 [Chryseobacterium indologenes]GAE66761.1 hypothetical protein CIN01S_18_00880 [Chryseobacterium indologenes NBRC 14944]SFK00973.1 hypothetical protein SAMN05421692_3112 [Chryseobacterium indologenes]SUX49588.1 Uncharacterised protein [Chryseobacterium indologenes]
MKNRVTNAMKPNLHAKFFWDTDINKVDWQKMYVAVITRIIERGGQREVDEIIRFYGREKVLKTLKDEIFFLPNYAIDDAIKFFPELKKEEMYCYLNRRNKPYYWI